MSTEPEQHVIRLTPQAAWALAAMIDSTPIPPDLIEELTTVRDEVRPIIRRGDKVFDQNDGASRVLAVDGSHAWLIDNNGERYTVTVASIRPDFAAVVSR